MAITFAHLASDADTHLVDAVSLADGRLLAWLRSDGRPTLLCSADGGARWRRVALPSQVSGNVTALAPQPRGGVALLDGGTLWRTDTLRSWRSLPVPSRGAFTPSASVLRNPLMPSEVTCCLAGAPASFLLKGWDYHSYTCDEASALYRLDEGATALRRLLAGPWPLDRAFAVGERLFATRHDGYVFVSTDDGATWALHRLPRDGRAQVDASGRVWLAPSGEADCVYVGSDLVAGLRARPLPAPRQLDALSVRGDVVVLRCRLPRPGFLISEDGGATWSEVDVPEGARAAQALIGPRGVVIVLERRLETARSRSKPSLVAAMSPARAGARPSLEQAKAGAATTGVAPTTGTTRRPRVTSAKRPRRGNPS